MSTSALLYDLMPNYLQKTNNNYLLFLQ